MGIPDISAGRFPFSKFFRYLCRVKYLLACLMVAGLAACEPESLPETHAGEQDTLNLHTQPWAEDEERVDFQF